MTAHHDDVVLWRPTGQAERDLVAASGWRAWPPRLPDQPIFYPVRNAWYATKIAREWNVPAEGVGHVLRFTVRREHLDRYPVRQVGGRDVLEHWIPAEELDEFNANIVGAITEVAEYRAPVADEEFARLDHPVPGAWREYLQGPSWFRRGWLGEQFVQLDPPTAADDNPGFAVIGGDGSRELLVLDLRQDPTPVLLVDITSERWADGARQADDVGDLIERVESGTFRFTW